MTTRQPTMIPNPLYCDRCEGRGYLVADAEWEPYAVQCDACKDRRPAKTTRDMANSGYLGGGVSMAERHRLRDKYLTPIAHLAVDKGLRHQCRCGGTLYVKWRGRWYCPRDGRWVRQFPAP